MPIHLGPKCRFCGSHISQFIAKHLGSERFGYICFRCYTVQRQSYQDLGRELSNPALSNLEVVHRDAFNDRCPGASPNCSKTPDGRDWFAIFVDGKFGLWCPECADYLTRHNRSVLKGTEAEFRMKLA